MQLTFRHKSVSGHYEFRLSKDELDGKVIESEGRSLEIRFSFVGFDEMDEDHGYGEAVLSDDDKTLTGKLFYHLRDDYTGVFAPLCLSGLRSRLAEGELQGLRRHLLIDTLHELGEVLRFSPEWRFAEPFNHSSVDIGPVLGYSDVPQGL
jgi:hypothetical protein